MTYEVKTRFIHNTSGLFSQGDCTDRPCPAITIGVGALNSIHYQVEYYLTDAPPIKIMTSQAQTKPPYQVPSMAEIVALPQNGYKAISLFSGAGGSCLGYRMAGFKVPLPTPSDLSRVIRCIEMPYKAQVEIGWPCLKLAEAMQADGFKVTFSGEGSDELWASYGFAYHALKTQNWHTYRKELFLSQARKNFARCNKIFMAHSIECRLPFLHPPLVEFALSLPQAIVQDGKARPKAIIQDAFLGKLPEIVTQRPKVAFQDGMGIKEAIGKILPSPERFYNAEYSRYYN